MVESDREIGDGPDAVGQPSDNVGRKVFGVAGQDGVGAVGAGDIGTHFPPADPRWRDAASEVFLRHARVRVAGAGGTITNVDLTLVCERPRIAEYRDAMVASVARILGIGPDRVSIKGTTTERLGFTGREEGIAAQAVATVRIAQ